MQRCHCSFVRIWFGSGPELREFYPDNNENQGRAITDLQQCPTLSALAAWPAVEKAGKKVPGLRRESAGCLPTRFTPRGLVNRSSSNNNNNINDNDNNNSNNDNDKNNNNKNKQKKTNNSNSSKNNSHPNKKIVASKK